MNTNPDAAKVTEQAQTIVNQEAAKQNMMAGLAAGKGINWVVKGLTFLGITGGIVVGGLEIKRAVQNRNQRSN